MRQWQRMLPAKRRRFFKKSTAQEASAVMQIPLWSVTTPMFGKECLSHVPKTWTNTNKRLHPPLLCQGPLNGGVSNGGVFRSGPVLPFLSFLGLSQFFWDFPDLLGDGPGIFRICSSPLSRPIKSTNEEQSRKGPRRNLDLSRKK